MSYFVSFKRLNNNLFLRNNSFLLGKITIGTNLVCVKKKLYPPLITDPQPTRSVYLSKKEVLWHLTPNTWHLTPDTWHLTPDTWHVTPDMWNMVCMGMEFLPWIDRLQVQVPQMVYGVCNKERGYCNTRCKGSSTQYGRPQTAGLQKFSKFPAGESVTPRGDSIG